MTFSPATDEFIELSPPDLSRYRAGNTGIPYVTTWRAKETGPHVAVTALTHGNEICGAIALDRLFSQGIRPVRGSLTLAFTNIAAYATFDPERPHRSRYVDEDFNRVWGASALDGPRQSVELDRARALRPLIDSVDLLLDIHSMTVRSPPLMLAGLYDKSVAWARRVGAPEIVMRDSGHADGTRLRDYGAFGDAASSATALLVECGPHWRRQTGEIAVDIALRFLTATGTIEPPADLQAATPQRLLDVTDAITVVSDRFVFARDFVGLEIIPDKGTIVARDGDRAVVTPYDNCVIVMPSAAAEPGKTAMRLGRFSSWP